MLLMVCADVKDGQAKHKANKSFFMQKMFACNCTQILTLPNQLNHTDCGFKAVFLDLLQFICLSKLHIKLLAA
jgi:hypothetical protein